MGVFIKKEETAESVSQPPTSFKSPQDRRGEEMTKQSLNFHLRLKASVCEVRFSEATLGTEPGRLYDSSWTPKPEGGAQLGLRDTSVRNRQQGGGRVSSSSVLQGCLNFHNDFHYCSNLSKYDLRSYDAMDS
ncbi:hypothetical protein EYF80_037820 [Liparis tanakae]|uniref:Uncharacterized protein n=1 Tax=Liparis tanakae TaxID=230148 RepID=A0A4Z2GFA8_9TELE|nr:hypothetical protein EYF80_037820 [Liparis tanakae]